MTRGARVLLVAAALAAGLLAGPAAAQRLEPGQSVLDRPRPAYQAHGVVLGPATVHPSLELRQTWIDNPLARPEGSSADLVTTIAPALDIGVSGRRFDLGLAAGLARSFHWQRPGEDTLDWSLTADGAYSFGRGGGVRAAALAARSHLDRGDPNAVGGVSPTPRTDLTLALGGTEDRGRIEIDLSIEVRRVDFDDVAARGGGRLDNDARDRTAYSAAYRVDYRLTPGIGLFQRTTGNLRLYDRPDPATGVQRNSVGSETVVGAAFALTGITVGEAFVGWRQQSYADAALTQAAGLAAGLSLQSSPTELTTLNLGLTRSIAETTQAFASGILTTELGFGVDHELLRNLLLNADLRWRDLDYVGIGRRDTRLDLSLGARWLVNPWLHGTLRVGHERRLSSAPDGDFVRNRIELRARLQY
jgi:hypothetical protein